MEDSSDRTDFRNRKRVLVIMAKAPRPGMVKTRLSQSLPSSAVTQLYRCLLEDTITLARTLKDVQVAVMCPESDKDELDHLLLNTVPVVAQRGEGLAAGLISVFAHFTASSRQDLHHSLRNTGPAWGPRDVIAFNSDSPHLGPSVLASAFQKLSECDLVIGPTLDGGYYLVGAKASHPTLFENDGLGTKSALERLLTRARTLELSTSLSEPFYDIDVVDDLIRLHGELQREPARAPRTAAWFTHWKNLVAELTPRREMP